MAALHGRGVPLPGSHGRTSENIRDLGLIFPEEQPKARHTAGTLRRGHNYDKNQDLYLDHSERGWTGEVQLEAMDTEGIDAAVLFPSRGLGVLTYPEHPPAFAAALARAYNDWLHDFCRADPERLFGAGMISVYDMDDAVNETRRVAGEYGFRSVFLRSNIVIGKPLHDPYYEPLWDTLEESASPSVFTRHPDRARPRAASSSSPTSACGASTPSPSSR